MDVAPSRAYWRREHQLPALPAAGNLRTVPWFRPAAEADRGEEPGLLILIDHVDADLDVHAILGGQPRH